MKQLVLSNRRSHTQKRKSRKGRSPEDLAVPKNPSYLCPQDFWASLQQTSCFTNFVGLLLTTKHPLTSKGLTIVTGIMGVWLKMSHLVNSNFSRKELKIWEPGSLVPYWLDVSLQFSFKQVETGLVVQWLRLCLTMQGMQVWSLVGELRLDMSRGQKTNKQSRSDIVTNSIKTLKWSTSKKKNLKKQMETTIMLACQSGLREIKDNQSH